jgi:hypothetical protein
MFSNVLPAGAGADSEFFSVEGVTKFDRGFNLIPAVAAALVEELASSLVFDEGLGFPVPTVAILSEIDLKDTYFY